MAYDYLRPAREQLFLVPVSMRDWLKEGHLAWFAIDVIAKLDTTAFDQIHPNDGAGRPAYDPQMMCALLLYGYATGVRSSRAIERSCATDAAFRVICGGLAPDHATIARFVCDQQEPLAGLFEQGLSLLETAGLIDLQVLALDGTKIAASAALDRNRKGEWIKERITELLAQTAASEQGQAPAPDPLQGMDGVGPLAEISSRSGRLARLQAALAVIEAQKQQVREQAHAKAQAAFAAAEQGRKLNGRKPKDPAAALARAKADHMAVLARAKAKHGSMPGSAPEPDPEQDPAVRQAAAKLAAAQARAEQTPAGQPQANITDPDSRIMKTRKGWVQGYNTQAIATEQQIVLACEVSQNTNDVELYEPMIEKLRGTLTNIGINATQIGLMLADAGYCSEENLTAPGPERLIATLKDHKQRRAARQLGTTTGPPPTDATATEAMEHRLRTPEGAAAYSKRSHLIEPVFGDRKHNRGYRSFRRRGLPAVQSEWAFMHFAGNTLKLYHHQQTTAPQPA